MVGLDLQSAPKQLINEVPSHVVLVNDKVGANPTSVGHNSELCCMRLPHKMVLGCCRISHGIMTGCGFHFTYDIVPQELLL